MCAFFTQLNIKLKFNFVITVQGSHRESSKQNKDLSELAQPTSSNLNNPNGLAGGKSVVADSTTTDSDANRNGPYFDVAASKNVCITCPFAFLFTHSHVKLFPNVGHKKLLTD